MTEQTNDKEKLPHAPGERDWFLQTLVEMANESPASLGYPITLCVNGLLVSGLCVSGLEYFTGFAETMAASLRDADADESTVAKVRDSFASLGAIYQTSEGTTAEAGDAGETNDPKPRPEFIHLKGALMFNGNTFVPTHGSGVWWRGRISEVDGFILGTLGQG